MSDKPWKKAERSVASLFATVRTALSGGNSKVTRSDTHHPKLFVETKLLASTAIWSLFLKTQTFAKVEGKIPLLAIKQRGRKGALIICHQSDLETVAIEYLKAQGYQFDE